jgi:hypothetical protein
VKKAGKLIDRKSVIWYFVSPTAPSSRGPGQVVLSHQTGVRIPVALPAFCIPF